MTVRPSTRRTDGFTLIELMVVVAIIGMLAAIAIPAFMKNARKAKTSEATVHIRQIYGASRSYIFEERAARGQAGVSTLPPQFPEAIGITPGTTCCAGPGMKCIPSPADWAPASWQVLHFDMTDPHYYRYAYDSTGAAGAGLGSRFTARALGDLNCDGVFSTYEMVGVWSDVDHDVHGSAGVYANNPLE
jgi:type IV pilus assembly protein PilA